MSIPGIGWPAGWTRQRRSQATIVTASLALVLALWVAANFIALAPAPIGPNAKFFAEGMVVTVELTIVAGLIGVVLGLLAALGKGSRILPLRWISGFYIWVIRGTPLLVQIFFVYFALPEIAKSTGSEWLGQVSRMSEFTAAVLALSLNVGAYNAEAFRAGLEAVHKGQFEAARSLGLSKWHTLLDVTFPQAFKVALPPLVNNVVALLKDSSLAYSIGVVELTNVGARVQSSTFQPVPILITTAILYLVMTTLLTQITNGIEHRFDIEGRRA
ncbi:amino acid ABC transporter permease [Ideonella sp.]|uniref:amino acid ABC transporter permease n=1 Tax=Ideonella sp. TaxID=1929293 RepID=UPI0035ADF40A